MASHSGNYLAVELDGTISGPTSVELGELFAPSSSDNEARVDPESFRTAMRQLASGVVMVTTEVDGRPWGLTISACCSLSVEPPELLISLGRHTMSRRAIRRRRRFGVSILGEDQTDLARLGSGVGAPKFVDEFCGSAGESDEDGAPMIRGALCHIVCRVARTYEQPTHDLFIGAVTKVVPGTPQVPLVYFEREFHALGRSSTPDSGAMHAG